MKRISGKINILATALEPIHHGAGVSGNTQLLRVQETVLPDGRSVRTPFVSGNSLKHLVREHGARFALNALGVKDGVLTKGITDLLFTGGALTKIGSNINLARARELERLFPLLGLCGYSAGNSMSTSKLGVDNLHLACEENAWRMPEEVRALPIAAKRAGYLRGEEFGTRHESSRRPHVARMLTSGETKRLEALTEKKEKGDSLQMIYEFEVVKPGAVFWGAMHLDDAAPMEVAALKSAMSAACQGEASDGGLLFRIGAKQGVGYGAVSMRFSGTIREPVQAPRTSEAKDLVKFGDGGADVKAYVAHLRDNRDQILAAVAEAAA